jgi:hypothetical protein
MIEDSKYIVLSKLAKVNTEKDEFSHLDTEDLGDDLSQAVAELHKEEKAQAVKQAAQVVLSQLNQAKDHIEIKRKKLSSLRREEKETISSIETIAVAMAYGRETQNFLPLALALESGGQKVKVVVGPAEMTIPEKDYDRLLAVVRNKQKEVNSSRATAKKATVK